jgi:hypothetical protein
LKIPPEYLPAYRPGRPAAGAWLMLAAQNWLVERRDDGAVIVRVPSTGTYGVGLPDAVFSFRAGDPQYAYWQEQVCERTNPQVESAT